MIEEVNKEDFTVREYRVEYSDLAKALKIKGEIRNIELFELLKAMVIRTIEDK